MIWQHWLLIQSDLSFRADTILFLYISSYWLLDDITNKT